MKKEKGSITIEASIVLTLFIFFILTFVGFGDYFRVQNAMKHSINQTAITFYHDSELKAMLSDLPGVDIISGVGDIIGSIAEKIGSKDAQAVKDSWDSWAGNVTKYDNNVFLYNSVKKMITYYLTGTLTDNSSEMDTALEKMRIYNLKINETQLSDDKSYIEIKVSYEIKPKLAFWKTKLSFDDKVKMKINA